MAPLAQLSAPRISLSAPGCPAASSMWTTTPGSSRAIRPSKSAERNALKKASTTFLCSETFSRGTVAAPCTRRRARLASCRAASGDRPIIEAISSKGMANMSCKTNASRSAGTSRSSTTSNARPTESARIASCSGSGRRFWRSAGSGSRSSIGSSCRAVRDRNMSRHTRATTVVSHARDSRCFRHRSAAAGTRIPGRRHRPHSASRACGRPHPAGALDFPRIVPPAIPAQAIKQLPCGHRHATRRLDCS
jgi:hypothetical protein